MTALTIVAAFAYGFALWIFGEYVLHRFAMHALNGKGIMSREHLEHHVAAGWSFSHIHLLSWAGMAAVGFLAWRPMAAEVWGSTAGWSVAVGWAVGYFFYEYQHAMAHLRAPKTRYQRWLRKHHFHHHFGHPRSNHGVTLGIWDRVFGTLEVPEQVRVPRRMAQPWMLDEAGELRPELAADYVLVGSREPSERSRQLDRARAFASVAPEA